jgi:hypothetical protein
VPAIEQTLPTAAIPGDPGGPIAKVDSDATVCAQFMTGRAVVSNSPWAQPDPAVRAEVGNFGRYLHGSPHVQVFGSLTKFPSLYIDTLSRLPVPAESVVAAISQRQSMTPAVTPLPGFCAF